MSKGEQPTAILQLPPQDFPTAALVVGDPDRAQKAADQLDNARLVTDVREYRTYVGEWKGTPVAVSSHGVGGGGASVCFEELIQVGVTTIIRAGTCGSFQPQYREASLIIATGAVRRDGVSDFLVPSHYPAVAHHNIVQALLKAVQAHADLNYGVGLVLSDGPFYPGVLDNMHQTWAQANVLAVEMEVAALLVIASLHGIQAGAVLNVDNYVFERKVYQPNREIVHQGTARMLEVALDALITTPD